VVESNNDKDRTRRDVCMVSSREDGYKQWYQAYTIDVVKMPAPFASTKTKDSMNWSFFSSVLVRVTAHEWGRCQQFNTPIVQFSLFPLFFCFFLPPLLFLWHNLRNGYYGEDAPGRTIVARASNRPCPKYCSM
jgi:hypothetical protein